LRDGRHYNAAPANYLRNHWSLNNYLPQGLPKVFLMPRPSKASVSVIGTGRLGTALALALYRSGYSIVGLVAEHGRKAEKVAALLRKEKHGKGARVSTPLALSAIQLPRLPASDLILICTPDDEIEQLARKLARVAKSGTVLHTSGALSSEVLAPLTRAGLSTGSVHPLVSVSDSKAGADALRGAFFGVEGDPQAIRVARRIVRDLQGRSFSVPSGSKALYHAAAVMASPHATALFDVAVSALVAAGLSRRTARRVLIPLMESTVRNLKTSDPADALTGTFARGDVATVRRHLKALAGKEHGSAREIYKLLGLHSLELAQTKGLDPKLIKKIRKLLK
jgi:predicted short-subunit dehydrogenase-like oxidoreductase (DUF2520 family)